MVGVVRFRYSEINLKPFGAKVALLLQQLATWSTMVQNKTEAIQGARRVGGDNQIINVHIQDGKTEDHAGIPPKRN